MGTTFKKLSNIKLKSDIQEIEESGFLSVVDATSGLDVFFTKNFGSISSIKVSAENNPLYPVNATYEYFNSINPVKFKVYLYSLLSYPSLGINAGDKVAGNFSYTVTGTERVST